MENVTPILNCEKSIEAEHDWDFQTAIDSGFLKTKSPLSEEIDLRRNWWTIGNQRDTGSCVGWATADSCLRWLFTESKMLPSNELLSVRFVWMASKEKDEFCKRPSSFIESAGTSIKAALDIVRKYGCVTEDILPFNGSFLSSKSENKFYSIASKYKIVNYFNLNKRTIDGLTYEKPNPTQWKEWLNAGNGPIIIRINIDNAWRTATKENDYLKEYTGEYSPIGGHAAAIVGYKPEGFIIRNSVGVDWGKEGYVIASFEYAEKAFNEAYGICIRFNNDSVSNCSV
jgi:hypothetical protein